MSVVSSPSQSELTDKEFAHELETLKERLSSMAERAAACTVLALVAVQRGTRAGS